MACIVRIPDNPVALTRVGRSAGSNLTLSALLKPWLEGRRFPVILEATPEEWGRIEEADRAFADLFQVLRVDVPPRDRALRIVLRQRAAIEQQHEGVLSLGALQRAVELVERYPSHKVLPGSVVDRLSRLAARHPGAKLGAEEPPPGYHDPVHLEGRLAQPGPHLAQAETPRSVLEPSRDLERLSRQIADAICQTISPFGVGVVIEAQHLCTMMRGVEKQNSVMSTSTMLGCFEKHQRTRMEFLRLINRG